jgi:hypothetical protein
MNFFEVGFGSGLVQPQRRGDAQRGSDLNQQRLRRTLFFNDERSS